MTEYDRMQQWRDWAADRNVPSWRIENVGLSLPDMFLIYKGQTLWQEFKVRKGNLIYFSKFQWANNIRLDQVLGDYKMNIIVFNPLNNKYELYTISEIRRLKPTASESVISKNLLKVSLLFSKPWISVSDKPSFKQYLEALDKNIFA